MTLRKYLHLKTDGVGCGLPDAASLLPGAKPARGAGFGKCPANFKLRDKIACNKRRHRLLL